jgi:hypothetical protein
MPETAHSGTFEHLTLLRQPGPRHPRRAAHDDGKWIWNGERIRTTSTFSEDGKVQRSLHEQSEDGTNWQLAMDVTLRRVD